MEQAGYKPSHPLIPPEQVKIQAKCFHPSGTWIAFNKEEIEGSVPARFEFQARQHPHRLAIKDGQRELTYHELNLAANRVAHQVFSRRGPHPEPVALFFEHGIPGLTALLGVLKAGKFYVPLDPLYPLARNNYMLADSGANLLLTNTRNLTSAVALANRGCDVINIDESGTSQPSENLDLALSADALAYIYYTSGSTGEPKGVPNTHRFRLLHAMRNANTLRISPQDRITHLTALSSSGATHEELPALLNGAAVIAWDLKKEGIRGLPAWMAQEQITIFVSTPSVFRLLVENLGGDDKLPDLRVIKLGGSPLYRRDFDLYQRHFSPDCLLVNMWGATEAPIFHPYFLERDTRFDGLYVPIGYSAQEVKILILDEDHRPVGRGQVGEITIQSRYLTPGYWNKPDLTQAKFLPDPGGGDQRVFLTGDLSRWMPDGSLVHLGRRDSVVKIRGHSVETAEVEQALLNLQSIKEALVVAKDDQRGEKRLVAYLVHCVHPPPTVGAIRRSLKDFLPDFLIPSAYEFLDTLPLNPNGKIDLLALPEPSVNRLRLDTPHAAPGSSLEVKLTHIWAEMLDLHGAHNTPSLNDDPVIGVNDNFFELGGDSLLMTCLITRIWDEFHVELPLRVMLEAPTIADMADAIEKDLESAAKLSPAPDEKENLEKALKLLGDF